MNVSEKSRRLAILAMLTALSIILVTAIHFPLFVAAPFLEYDPADIPIFIGTFLLGPGAGLLLTAAVSVIQGATVSAQSGVIGMVMHLLSTGSFVLVAGNLYRKFHTRKGALAALCCGVVTMTLVMVLCNLILTPLFMNAPREAVMAMLLPVIVPFNLAKAGINAAITYAVYKPMARLARVESEIPAKAEY